MAVNRKLVAVVMADVVGYSRLMERDEAGTHERLRTLHRDLIAPKIAEHGGRTVKSAGDGILLEFSSATSALRCAVEIQREMGARNLYVAPDERIELRIGINLGDIIVDGSDILGDGVNVAARLEALAEPGGICVASAIWQQVHEDLGVEFIDAGEQQVKNIRKPIHVFRVALRRDAGAERWAGMPSAGRKTGSAWRPAWTIAGVALLLLATATAWWSMRDRGADATGGAAPPVRSVMVLPFSAASGDLAQSAVVARLTVDVTRALADSLRHVRVAPPGAADAYAAKLHDPRALGREANVRFLIEGELRSSEGQSAVTLRLTDTRDGKQVESERRIVTAEELAGVEAGRKATSAARVMLAAALARIAAEKTEAQSSADDLIDRATNLPMTNTVANARERRRLAGAAIKMDANLARAYAMRATADVDLYLDDFATPVPELQQEAEADSLRAVALDPNSVEAWMARANALRIRRNMTGALAANDRAREVDPTRYSVLLDRGFYYLDMARPDDALKIVAQLRPVIGTAPLALQSCEAYVLLAQYDRAVAECERVETQIDDWFWHANLTAAYAMQGDRAKSQQARERLMKAVPSFTLSMYEARFYPLLPDERKAMDKATFAAGLRKAGVPE